MGTKWTGGDVSAKYEKARLAASARSQTHISSTSSPLQTVQEPKVLSEGAKDDPRPRNRKVMSGEPCEEREARLGVRRSSRKKPLGSGSQSGGLKGFHDRVYGSLHGRGSGVLGVESNQ